jgi:hypothetical protein
MSTLGNLQSLAEVAVALNIVSIFTPNILKHQRRMLNGSYAWRIQDARKYSDYLRNRFSDNYLAINVISDLDEGYQYKRINHFTQQFSLFVALYSITFLIYAAANADENASMMDWIAIIVPMFMPLLLGVLLAYREFWREQQRLAARIEPHLAPIERLMKKYEAENPKPENDSDIKQWRSKLDAYVNEKLQDVQRG